MTPDASPRFVTFYSYKGGVGRSMALANVASWLVTGAHKRVVAIDFDLEAPGLTYYFGPSGLLGEEPLPRPGLVELLTKYRTEGAVPDLSDYVVSGPPQLGGGQLHLLCAGEHRSANYPADLAALDWNALYEHGYGFELMEHLRVSVIDGYQPDIVLIDSRTGLHGIGAIAAQHLPDAVVLLFSLNEQNVDGTAEVLTSIERNIYAEETGRTIETLLGGRQVTRYEQAGEQYDVIVQMSDIDRTNPNDLNRIYVKSDAGALVPLANLVSITETVAPKELNHFNQLRSAEISANLAEGYSLAEGLAVMEEAARSIVPNAAQIDYSGQSREFKSSSADIYVTFGLALAFIFLVLAAQFESFRDPLVILVTVPLSICGALIPLFLGISTLNIYTQVGLVTLIGLISKHGILIVEFANQLRRDKGLSAREAVEEAAAIRLRPVLMTTAAMVFGMVPLILATGAGAVSRFDIGLVIAVGMSVGTLFTLIVLPCVYTLLAARDGLRTLH